MARVKVMIAHKNHHTASQLAKTLIRYGYEVAGAVSTGVSALLMAECRLLDLILMGIMLKGPLDGITTAEKILSRSDLPIVYLAPNLDEELISQVKEILPYGVVTKPADERELQETITMALSRHAREKREKKSEEQLHAVSLDILRLMIPTGECR